LCLQCLLLLRECDRRRRRRNPGHDRPANDRLRGLGGAIAAVAPAALPLFLPITLALTGATGAVWAAGTVVIALAATVTAAGATAWAFTKVARGTAVTAPATRWFTYVVVCTTLFTTFVIVVCWTTVFVMFTFVT